MTDKWIALDQGLDAKYDGAVGEALRNTPGVVDACRQYVELGNGDVVHVIVTNGYVEHLEVRNNGQSRFGTGIVIPRKTTTPDA
jgi:hypothetical protein